MGRRAGYRAHSGRISEAEPWNAAVPGSQFGVCGLRVLGREGRDSCFRNSGRHLRTHLPVGERIGLSTVEIRDA